MFVFFRSNSFFAGLCLVIVNTILPIWSSTPPYLIIIWWWLGDDVDVDVDVDEAVTATAFCLQKWKVYCY